jgi:hypothetical protein
MTNILEITESRPVVQVSEAGNTLQVLAPNAIVVTDQSPAVTVTESVPQAIVQTPGPQGPVGINWKGAWSTFVSYVKSDAIHYGGSAYLNIKAAHSGGVVVPSDDSESWDLIVSNGATGIVWKGSWDDGTSYALLDAVESEGNSWICTLAHDDEQPPSHSSTSSAYWDLIVSKSLQWMGEYAGATRYEVDDLVTYNGTTWRNKVAGTGSTPPYSPNDPDANWDAFAQAAGAWRGEWGLVVTYYLNDFVTYRDNIWRCKVATVITSEPPVDFTTADDNWDAMLPKGVPGMVWQGNYAGGTTYAVDDVVFYSGTSWICIAASTGNDPVALSSFWDEVAVKGDQGIQGETGPTGATGAAGANGGAVGRGYTYDTNTTPSGTNGQCRFDNNSDLSAATACYLADADNDGTDVHLYIQSFDACSSSVKAYLTVAKKDDNSAFITYEISDFTDESGYTLITILKVAAESSSTPFADEDEVTVGLVRVGDRGTEWRNNWASGTPYTHADAILHNGSAWIALQESTGQEPGRTSGYWALLSNGGTHGAGGVVGTGWLFDTATGGTGVDLPPANKIRTNTALLNTATEIYIHKEDLASADNSTALNWLSSVTSSRKGYLRLTSANDNSRWAGFEITAITLDSNVYKFDVQEQEGMSGAEFTMGEEVSVAFSRVGDRGLNWIGVYDGSTAYSPDDVVSYISRIWRCKLATESGNAPGHPVNAYWELLTPGVQWRGAYVPVTAYHINDMVSYGGGSWISKANNHINNQPDISPDEWEQAARKGEQGDNGADGDPGADGAAGETVPVGTLLMYAGASAPGSGEWLLCQGQEISRSTYSDLYAQLSTHYGEGNGSSTFNIPDFRSKFPVMQGPQSWSSDLGEGTEPPATDSPIQNPAILQADYDAGERLLWKGMIPELDTEIATGTGSSGTSGDAAGAREDYEDPQTYDDNVGSTTNPWVKAGDDDPKNLNILPPYLTVNFIIRALAVAP